jgi:hypothetical protein
MSRRYFPGGTTGELLPSGEYIINVRGSGMLTHLGTVEFPAGESAGVLFPRCTIVGGFKFAGQRNSTISRAAEFVGGRWVSRDDLPYPTTNWPVIYDRLGQLHSNPVGGVGSQGYRYVTPANVIISGDATYGQRNGLNEYTDIGDGVLVGQSSVSFDALVFDGSTLRVLETGNRRFIVANRDGETVTIAMSDPSGVIFLQTTMSELRALPVFTSPTAPPPTPPAVPPPVPPAPPVPPVMPTPFDPSSVQFVDCPGDIASWPQTAVIRSVRFDGGFILVDHSGRETWPDLPFGDDGGGTVQYTLGLCCFVNGAWVGSAVVQFWKGRDLAAGGNMTDVAKNWFYDGRWGALQGHQPQPGELVAVFAAAGNDRNNQNPPQGANRQRTDFALVTWGQNYTSGVQPPPPQPPDPGEPPVPPSVDLSDILRRLAALEAKPSGFPSKIALKSSRGKYLRDDWGDSLGHFDRDSAGDGESYTIEDKS